MAENNLLQGDDLVQREENGFKPLFQRRRKTATFVSATMFAVAIIITVAMLFFTVKEKEKEIYSWVITIAQHTLYVVLGEMIRRLFLMCWEFKHKVKEHEREWKKIFEATVTNEYCIRSLVAAIFIIIICIVFSFLLYIRYEILPRPDFVFLLFLNSLVVNQLSHICGLRKLAPAETSDLIQKGNKSVAYGLAWGYYFNYLKLVLPVLKEQIAKSEQFRDQIREKKLFILVPQTCYIPANISEGNDGIKWAGNLPEIEIDSGGIKKKNYKNAVHEIEKRQPDGTVEKYHFVLEYPTTLQTIYNISRQADAPFDREERDHQVG